MILTFLVRNQTLTYLDTKLVPRIGSAEYLQLKFKFITSDWVNLRKTIQISSGEYSESYILESDIFDVPTYYTQQGSFDITFLGDNGGQVVPTNVVTVKLSESNRLWTAEPPDPQSSAYLQLMGSVGNLNDLKTSSKSNLVDAINSLVDGGSTAELDTTLSEAGKAADAKATGDAISTLSKEKLNAPTNTGTAGQVPVLQADGTTLWQTISAGVKSYSITANLTNCSSSNPATSVEEGDSYTAVLSAADNYELGTPSITMGGVDITETAWNADTSTISIETVTGKIVVTCLATVSTSPVIAQSDVGYNSEGVVTSFAGVAITKSYEFTPDIDGIKASGYYDETNDYTTQSGISGGIAVCTPSTKMKEAGYSTTGMAAKASKIVLFRDGVVAYTMSNSSLTSSGIEVSLQFPRYNSDAMYSNSIAFTISIMDAEDSYAYWKSPNGKTAVLPIGVREGDIIFAGKNTPYFGLANIDGTVLGETAVTSLSLDDDIARDYGVATLSLTPDLAADTSTVYGLSSAYASVLETIRNEWMIEYNGNANKIPIIIHTDQHGRMRNDGNVKGLFNTIGKAFSLHDVSKVMNLGDTVSVEWVDAETDHPLLSCTALENYLSTVEAIPFSKRLEVYGNHDTWYYNGYNDAGNVIGTRYPSAQNHLYKYFRNIYKKSNGNNVGYFAVCDDYFNVKYVIVSAYEYKNGAISNRMTSEQIEWIIREFSKDDGYDIVVVSHCPLYWDDTTGNFPEDAPTTTETIRIADDGIDVLWAGRKNKTSGTVNDSDGGSHTFDFTGCTSDLLCALHGHTHMAGYNYVSGSLLSVAFDWFDNESMYFCLIDRESRELKAWKFIGSDGGAPEYLTWVAPFDKQ